MAAAGEAAVIVGINGSRSATELVGRAAQLAAERGASLHVVSTISRADSLPDRGDIVPRGLAVPTRHHVLAGDPVEALCTVAALVGAELIVVADSTVAKRLRRSRPPICDRVVDLS